MRCRPPSPGALAFTAAALTVAAAVGLAWPRMGRGWLALSAAGAGACLALAAVSAWAAWHRQRRAAREAARLQRLMATSPQDPIARLGREASAARAAELERQIQTRLQAMVASLRAALSANAVVLYLRGPDERLHLRAAATVDTTTRFAETLDAEDKTLIWWVFRQAEPFLAAEYAKPVSGMMHYLGEPPEIKSFIAVPLLGHACMGVLAADSREVQAFNAAQHLSLLELMAVQVLEWLEAQRERSETLEELEQWRAFFAVANHLQKVQDIDKASGFLLDLVDLVVVCDAVVLVAGDSERWWITHVRSEREELKVGREFGRDESWVAWALKEKEPRGAADLTRRRTPLPLFFAGDGMPQVGSILCIPFAEVADRAAGGLVLWSDKPYQFDTAISALLARVVAPFQLAYARAQAVAALERLATTDGLTGLFNRRLALDRLHNERERAGRSGRPLTVILLDVDHFKSVNDTHGHDVGDAVLKAVAATLAKAVRSMDTAARYGGEEFLLILPETDVEGGMRLAERTRQALEKLRLKLPQGGSLKLTASFGVATWKPGGHAESIEGLLKRADEALYAAKSGGRNRVCVSRAEATRV